MCIGIPMQIDTVDGVVGHCLEDGRRVAVDLSLVPDAGPGDWVLSFLGTAREKLTPERAQQVLGALELLAAVMNGNADAEGVANGFADLIDREPQLPPHLEAARAAGLKEA